MNQVKKYISFRFDSEQFFIEIDSEGYALRQIIKNDNGNIHISCIEDCLAEGSVTEYIDEIDECYIDKNKFEEVWQDQTSKIRETWNAWKKTLLFGDTLSGKVLYHYPQGWIVAVDSNFALLKSYYNYNIGQEVNGKVESIDDENMWVILQ